MTSKGTILVVDDDPRNIKLLSARLRADGYGVVAAESGVEALALARAHRPSMMLSDVMMPSMDGIELTRHFRLDPELREVPIVLMTAYSDTGDRARGLLAGADDFLTKPFDPMELTLRVRAHVRVHRLQVEAAARIGHRFDTGRQAKTGPGHVLVIDDDNRYCEAVVRSLTTDGHTLSLAHSLAEARALLREMQPELVLLDLALPDGRGEELVPALRAHRGSNGPTAIVVLTGSTERSRRLRVLDLGVDDVVDKLVSAEELRARVHSHLRRARATGAVFSELKTARLRAQTDPLTGLFNRGFLDNDLAGRIREGAPSTCGFCLALVDLDHFKAINDSFGHPAGDEVLRAVAALFRSELRGSDLACRYGGEEFAIVLPALSAEDASACIDRIRRCVAAMQWGEMGPRCVTFSAGVASWTPGEHADTVIDRADRALYEAKKDGRNRVHVAGVKEPSFEAHGAAMSTNVGTSGSDTPRVPVPPAGWSTDAEQ